MLQAKNKKGKLVTLALLTKLEIEKIKSEKYEFHCPTCGSSVIMKAGSVMIPHFAHQSSMDCPQQEGGESVYHEQGKLMLYRWLRSQHLDAQLEVFIPEINQRPDILLQVNNRLIAIEYQCARIPQEEVRSRNQGYIEKGIIPIWIIGANRLKRKSRHHFKVDQLTLKFLHQFSSHSPKLLYYFCPNTLQFISVHDISIQRNGTGLGKIYVRSLPQLTFKDIFIPHWLPNDLFWKMWHKEKKRFRLQKKKLYGEELAWQQWLYLKHTHLEYLPSIIHLPTASQFRMKTPSWNWQSRICLEILDPLSVGQTFHLKACIRLLHRQIIPSSYFPLIHAAGELPVTQYLRLLEQIDIIEEIAEETYRKITPLTFHKHIEDSLHADEILINQLKSNKIQA